jgi:Mg2+ and Co2+ transporter CorA
LYSCGLTLDYYVISKVLYRLQYGSLPPLVPVDWILYKFLDMITDEFVLMVDMIYCEIDRLDRIVADIGDSNKEEILRRMGMFGFERSLV